MVEVKWTNQSLEDIHNIGEYIATDSEKFAAIQVEKFFEKAEMLSKYPKIGRIVPEIGRQDIRELISGNYRIIYKIISNQRIDILTIHHGARLLSNTAAFKKIVRRKR
jgi:toxin ParE1/3/4